MNDSDSNSFEDEDEAQGEEQVYDAADTAVVHMKDSVREKILKKKDTIHIKADDFWATELTITCFMKEAVEKFKITPKK